VCKLIRDLAVENVAEQTNSEDEKELESEMKQKILIQIILYLMQRTEET
jgi:hypothetical protein